MIVKRMNKGVTRRCKQIFSCKIGGMDDKNER